MHKHAWKRSSRKHGRPPRFFVECTRCSERAQAVVREGHLHVFQTNRKRGGSNVIAFRVTDEQFERYNRDREGYQDKFRDIISSI